MILLIVAPTQTLILVLYVTIRVNTVIPFHAELLLPTYNNYTDLKVYEWNTGSIKDSVLSLLDELDTDLWIRFVRIRLG